MLPTQLGLCHEEGRQPQGGLSKDTQGMGETNPRLTHWGGTGKGGRAASQTPPNTLCIFEHLESLCIGTFSAQNTGTGLSSSNGIGANLLWGQTGPLRSSQALLSPAGTCLEGPLHRAFLGGQNQPHWPGGKLGRGELRLCITEEDSSTDHWG